MFFFIEEWRKSHVLFDIVVAGCMDAFQPTSSIFRSKPKKFGRVLKEIVHQLVNSPFKREFNWDKCNRGAKQAPEYGTQYLRITTRVVHTQILYMYITKYTQILMKYVLTYHNKYVNNFWFCHLFKHNSRNVSVHHELLSISRSTWQSPNFKG